MIAKGASLEAYDLYYGTPLHVACAKQHLECVKVLLNAGKTRYHELWDCEELSHVCKHKNVLL